MKRKFITFADSRMRRALARIARQAQEMNFFDEIETLTEHDLDVQYIEKHKHLLKRSVRGFGYWVWKPYVIWSALQTMEDGDELYYVDAGCHFNPKGRPRMFEYAEILRENALGLAGFELTPDCSVGAFTKMDLLVYMGGDNIEELRDCAQICATHVFCRKNEKVKAFLAEWLKICEHIHLVDDSPSIIPNSPRFIEHRHDQSVFTILCLQHGAALLPGRETWPANNSRDWGTMQNYPIWDKRDLGYTTHLFSRLWRKLRQRFIKPLLRFK